MMLNGDGWWWLLVVVNIGWCDIYSFEGIPIMGVWSTQIYKPGMTRKNQVALSPIVNYCLRSKIAIMWTQIQRTPARLQWLGITTQRREYQSRSIVECQHDVFLLCPFCFQPSGHREGDWTRKTETSSTLKNVREVNSMDPSRNELHSCVREYGLPAKACSGMIRFPRANLQQQLNQVTWWFMINNQEG